MLQSLLGLALSVLLLAGLVAQERPNIVLIYADDLGYKDTGFMGSDFYETPHLDALRKEGMLFTDAYSSSANCAPSRASLMTGVYTPRHEVYTVNDGGFAGDFTQKRWIPVFNRRILNPNFQTLPRLLQEQGYATLHVGKWHLSPGHLIRGFGFDENIAGNRLGRPNGGYFSPYKNGALKDGPEGEHLPARLAEETKQWISEQEKPFFVYLSFYSVHKPIEAREDLLLKYQQKQAGELHDHAAYAAMIEAMDEAIGEVVEHLRQENLWDNTLIVFSSDNGPYGPISSPRPLRGAKGTFFEGGIRVPTLMTWPGKIPANSSSAEPIHQIDFLPTLVGAAGIEPEKEVDGVSLAPLFAGESLKPRALFWHFPSYLAPYRDDENSESLMGEIWRAVPCSVIREGEWKLLENFETDEFELYHLGEDLSEANNLAEEKPEKLQELKDKLAQWQQQTQAFIPTEENRNYQPAAGE